MTWAELDRYSPRLATLRRVLSQLRCCLLTSLWGAVGGTLAAFLLWATT